MKKIIAFAGSNNPNSINHQLVMTAARNMPAGCVTVLNLSAFSVPMYSEEAERQSGIPAKILDLYSLFKDADGFLIASPEHNGLPPAFFKNIIDWLSRIEMKFFGNKPVMMISTSHGKTGGQSNLNILSSLMPRWGASIVISYSLGSFGEYFDSKECRITNENEQQKFIDALHRFLSAVCAEFSLAHPQTIHQSRRINFMKKLKLILLMCLLLTSYITAPHNENVGRSTLNKIASVICPTNIIKVEKVIKK